MKTSETIIRHARGNSPDIEEAGGNSRMARTNLPASSFPFGRDIRGRPYWEGTGTANI